MSKAVRAIEVSDGVLKIPLASGGVALADLADAELLSQHNWHKIPAAKTIYAATNLPRQGGGYRPAKMHRLILGDDDPRCVDHINGDGLDNRRANLRYADRSQSCFNRSAFLKDGREQPGGVKGVSWSASSRKWKASISAYGERFHLGYFAAFAEAVSARLEAEARLHGEFARRA